MGSIDFLLTSLEEVQSAATVSRRNFLGWLGMIGLTFATGNLSAAKQSEKILTRSISSSGEQIPVVGLGTWQTFDEQLDSEARSRLSEVLSVLYERGGRVVDSSPMYGRSEAVVGELTEELGINNKLFFATKVWTRGKSDGIEQMNDSFRLMRRAQIDLMQVHNLIDWETHLKTLREWKAEKKIRYLGVTHYTTRAFSQIASLMKTEHLDFIQIPFSIEVPQAEEEIFPLAQETRTAVLINRPYEGGSLFRRVNGKQLPQWAKEIDCFSWGQFFLKYILGHPAVTCVIPGTGNPKHMKDNIQAAFGQLPDRSQRKEMVRYFESL